MIGNSSIYPGQTLSWDVWAKYGIATEAQQDQSTVSQSNSTTDNAGNNPSEASQPTDNDTWEKISQTDRNENGITQRDPTKVVIIGHGDNPYALPLQPKSVSYPEWRKILDDHAQELLPKQLKIIEQYRENGYADELNVYAAIQRQKESTYGRTCSDEPNPDHGWEIGTVNEIIKRKLKQGYVMTPEERECFSDAASYEWTRDHTKYNVETQSAANDVSSALSKNGIALNNSDSFSLKFDQNLKYTVTGTDANKAKTIENIINGNISMRFNLADCIYHQTTTDGKWVPDSFMNPSTTFERKALRLEQYMSYKMNDADLRSKYGFGLSDVTVSGYSGQMPIFTGKTPEADQQLKSNEQTLKDVYSYYESNGDSFVEPTFPQFMAAPITYSINGFSANTSISEDTIYGSIFNTTA